MKKCDFCEKSLPGEKCGCFTQGNQEVHCRRAIELMVDTLKNIGLGEKGKSNDRNEKSF